MDKSYAPQPIARWFMPAAIASLLFMLLGCVMYLLHVSADPAAMPADQRAAYEAVPAWAMAGFAVATWGGALGTLLLVMKRRFAEKLLLISLIGVIVWLAAFFVDPRLRDAVSTNDLVVPIIVTLLTWTIFWFARHSRQRGWLK